ERPLDHAEPHRVGRAGDRRRSRPVRDRHSPLLHRHAAAPHRPGRPHGRPEGTNPPPKCRETLPTSVGDKPPAGSYNGLSMGGSGLTPARDPPDMICPSISSFRQFSILVTAAALTLTLPRLAPGGGPTREQA